MTSQPALVIVTSSFPISGDGSEAAGAFVADLAEELAKHIPVRVVAPGRVETRDRWSEGVEVFRYTAPDQALSTLRPWHPGDGMHVLRVLRAGQRATKRAVAAGPTAHVLALWALPCGYWARRSVRRHGIRYSVWTLGSDIWSLGRIPLVRTLLRQVLRDAEHCWSDGLKLRDDTKAIAGRSVEFVPSTRRIDRTRIEPLRSKPPYRLLFLGRWHPNKGIDLLLEALHLLSDDDWSLIERVTIAGGGQLESIVQTEVEALRVRKRPIELHGYLERGAAQQAFLDADYLLIPSRIESIPLVFSDGVKMQCAIIACPVGDLARLVEGVHPCGIIARSATAQDLSDAIARAVHTPVSDFESGIDKVRKAFDPATVAKHLAKLLSQ